MVTQNEERLRVSIGARVREARLRRNMSQMTVASRIGITQSALSNYETGKRALPLVTLFRIADVLRVPIADLIVLTSRPRRAGRGLSSVSSLR